MPSITAPLTNPCKALTNCVFPAPVCPFNNILSHSLIIKGYIISSKLVIPYDSLCSFRLLIIYDNLYLIKLYFVKYVRFYNIINSKHHVWCYRYNIYEFLKKVKNKSIKLWFCFLFGFVGFLFGFVGFLFGFVGFLFGFVGFILRHCHLYLHLPLHLIPLLPAPIDEFFTWCRSIKTFN